MTTNSFISSLKEIQNCFQHLRQLLDEDKNFINNKNVLSIEESNKKKSAVLENLAHRLNEFKSAFIKQGSNSFLEAIEANTNNFPPHQKNEVQTIAKNLESEMVLCFESLAINNKIVLSNLQRLKDFWGKLSDLQLQRECVYDAKANTNTK